MRHLIFTPSNLSKLNQSAVCPHSVHRTILLWQSKYYRNQTRSATSATSVPSESKVVICGGGLTGTCIAYNLAKHWPKNVIVIDAFKEPYNKYKQTSAVISHLKPSVSEIELVKESSDLFATNQCGALYIATTFERLNSLKRLLTTAKITLNPDDLHLLTPREIKDRWPWLNDAQIKGGAYLPIDGIVSDLTSLKGRIRNEAERYGAFFFEKFLLKRVIADSHNRVSQVEVANLETEEQFTIKCDYFVNSAGFWAKSVGKLSSPYVKVPVVSCEHNVLETEQCPQNVSDELDIVVHDCDKRMHFYRREDNHAIINGWNVVSKGIDTKVYKKSAEALVSHRGVRLPQLEPDWRKFYPFLDAALNRYPNLRDSKLFSLLQRVECYTPDGNPIVGESQEITNYYVVAGVKPELSGGVGKLVAKMITKENDDFERDFWQLDQRRFVPLHNNKSFLEDRIKEVPGRSMYGLHFPQPFDDFKTGHCLRLSPIYPRFVEAGAVFAQIMGYERPAVFIPPEDTVAYEEHVSIVKTQSMAMRHPVLKMKSFGEPQWLEVVRSEYEACREGVAILDYTSFTKLELSSPGTEVLDLLQRLCSNDVDISTGSIVHTGMHNEEGGYENDCSLVRVAPNYFMLIGPTEQQQRCVNWIERHSKDSRVHVQDTTGSYTAICLMGPLSKFVLAEVVSEPDELDSFPFFTFKELEVGLASQIRVCNLTHTGELGWVLYVPNEYALHVYDILINAGRKFGIRNAGSIAMRTLRIEKFYAFWGQDLDAKTTPFECGRAFRVKFDKEFIGKQALLRQRDEGIKRRYVQLVLQDFDVDAEIWPWGGEPIYLAGGDRKKPVGMTTTTCYGFTIGRHVCLGFVRHPNNEVITNDYVLKSEFEVEIGGRRYRAKANIHSPKLTDVVGTYMATR